MRLLCSFAGLRTQVHIVQHNTIQLNTKTIPNTQGSIMAIACTTSSGIAEKSAVPNFRASAGCHNIFRCAAPDQLGFLLKETQPSKEQNQYSWPEPERRILYDVTLILDLRMESEIDRKQYQTLTHSAPGGPFEQVNSLEEMAKSSSKRQHFRPTGEYGFSKTELLAHVGKAWVPSDVWEKANLSQRIDLLVEELNDRGLVGLYEIILETKPYIRTVLQAITIHLENHKDGKVVFHCSIGKDRTGIIAMLCGKILGLNDSEIAEDFAKSSSIRAVAEIKLKDFFGDKVDVKALAEATASTMQDTIGYIRTNYGSFEHYLDSIGFDRDWQMRFRKAVSGS